MTVSKIINNIIINKYIYVVYNNNNSKYDIYNNTVFHYIILLFCRTFPAWYQFNTTVVSENVIENLIEFELAHEVNQRRI